MTEAIKQFMRDAVDGGWEPKFSRGMGVIEADLGTRTLNVIKGPPTLSWSDMFLDPEAWKAVGKVRGWNAKSPDGVLWYKHKMPMKPYLVLMHRMIDALAEGKTIDQYLESIQ